MKVLIYIIMLSLQSPESVIMCCNLLTKFWNQSYRDKLFESIHKIQNRHSTYEKHLIEIYFNTSKFQVTCRKLRLQMIVRDCVLNTDILQNKSFSVNLNAEMGSVFVLRECITKAIVLSMKFNDKSFKLIIILPITRKFSCCFVFHNRTFVALRSDDVTFSKRFWNSMQDNTFLETILYITKFKTLFHNCNDKAKNKRNGCKLVKQILSRISSNQINILVFPQCIKLVFLTQRILEMIVSNKSQLLDVSSSLDNGDNSQASHIQQYLANNSPASNLNSKQWPSIAFEKKFQNKKTQTMTEISNIKSNVYIFAENCPRKCMCFLEDNGDLTIGINCEDKQLTTVPRVIPFGTTYVNLRKNDITSFSDIKKYWWNNVTHLILKENQLKVLYYRNLPPRIVILDIASNYLTHLSLSIMKMVEVNVKNTIYLAGNQWNCTCQEYTFIEWFKRNKLAIPDYEDVYCYWFEEAILTEARSKISARTISCDLHHIIAGLTVVVVLLIVVPLTLLLILLYWFRRLIYAILNDYNLFPSWLDDSKFIADDGALYDIFICFHLRDRVITNTIIKTLGPKFLFCSQEHAWLPRSNADRDLLFRFLASKITLLVCSRRFVRSAWFQTEFRKLYYDEIKWRLARMIIIRVGGCEKDGGTDLLLRKIFPNEATLVWGEKWFWQKLRFALRHTASGK